MSHEFLLTVLLVLPFAGSVAAMLFPVNARNAEAWLAGAVTLGALIITLSFYADVANNDVVRATFEWLSAYRLDFVLRVDGYAWLLAVLVTGIGLLITLYARYYMSPQDPVPRFFSFLLAFMGSMLGVVLSGNLIQLVFFWELTSFFSFLLIGYWHHNAAAREGARMALVVTSTGGLCLFAGVLILGRIVGSYDLDDVLASGDLIRTHDLYLPALVLILLGALTKSAQFPFHFWLPNAMTAPTPVSAYLHSAAMVKLGVFLMARLWPVLSGTDAWFWSVGGAGLATLLLGAYAAMFQNDLKALLAYSTLSHLGLITLLLGLNSPLAAVAAVFHTMNHATFKASLFMSVGIVDHETGTRDMRRLHGLYRTMPVTGTLAIVASAAMAGVPLLNGFLSKEMFFSETVFVDAHPAIQWLLPGAATLAGENTHSVHRGQCRPRRYPARSAGTLPQRQGRPTSGSGGLLKFALREVDDQGPPLAAPVGARGIQELPVERDRANDFDDAAGDVGAVRDVPPQDVVSRAGNRNPELLRRLPTSMPATGPHDHAIPTRLN